MRPERLDLTLMRVGVRETMRVATFGSSVPLSALRLGIGSGSGLGLGLGLKLGLVIFRVSVKVRVHLSQRRAAVAAEVAGDAADRRGAAGLNDGVKALGEAGEQGERGLVGGRPRRELVLDLSNVCRGPSA